MLLDMNTSPSHQTPDGVQRLLDFDSKLPNANMRLAKLVTPALREQANKVERAMGLFPALELIRTLGHEQVAGQRCVDGGRRGGSSRRESSTQDAVLMAQARKWLRERPDTFLSPGGLAERITGKGRAQASRDIRRGLQLIRRPDAWPIGKQGPKKSPSNG
jgi:hypothetical protein